MKTLLIIILSFISSISIYSQNSEIDKLTSVKDELVIKKKEIIDSIEKINIRINYIKSKEKNFTKIQNTYSETTTKISAVIRIKPNVSSDIIGNVAMDENVKVYDYLDGYWLVEKDTLYGYMSHVYLTDNSQMKKLKAAHEKNKIVNKYGAQIAYRISNHEIWIGMTTTLTKLSIGHPKDINRTTGVWGVHEQWVYYNRYLYFENGILTSWQD